MASALPQFSATTRSGGSAVTVKSASSACPTSPLIRASFRRSFRSCVTAAIGQHVAHARHLLRSRDSRLSRVIAGRSGFGRFAPPGRGRRLHLDPSDADDDLGRLRHRFATDRPGDCALPRHCGHGSWRLRSASAAAGSRSAAPEARRPLPARPCARSFAASRRRGGAPARAGLVRPRAAPSARPRQPATRREPARAEPLVTHTAAWRPAAGQGRAAPGSALCVRGASGAGAPPHVRASICARGALGAGEAHCFCRSRLGWILGHGRSARPPRTANAGAAGCRTPRGRRRGRRAGRGRRSSAPRELEVDAPSRVGHRRGSPPRSSRRQRRSRPSHPSPAAPPASTSLQTCAPTSRLSRQAAPQAAQASDECQLGQRLARLEQRVDLGRHRLRQRLRVHRLVPAGIRRRPTRAATPPPRGRGCRAA